MSFFKKIISFASNGNGSKLRVIEPEQLTGFLDKFPEVDANKKVFMNCRDIPYKDKHRLRLIDGRIYHIYKKANGYIKEEAIIENLELNENENLVKAAFPFMALDSYDAPIMERTESVSVDNNWKITDTIVNNDNINNSPDDDDESDENQDFIDEITNK